jgi:hypothetical protein
MSLGRIISIVHNDFNSDAALSSKVGYAEPIPAMMAIRNRRHIFGKTLQASVGKRDLPMNSHGSCLG